MVKGESKRKVIVCVDSYENDILQGRFYYDSQTTAIPFHGLMQLLLYMDTCFDGASFPQAFESKRTFSEAELVKDKTAEQSTPLPRLEGTPEMGALVTFQIRLLFRQNTSWQGNVLWLEGKKNENFRSVLELIHLMHSVLVQHSCVPSSRGAGETVAE